MDTSGLGRDNGNGDERYRYKSGLPKRYKDTEVDRHEIERGSGG